MKEFNTNKSAKSTKYASAKFTRSISRAKKVKIMRLKEQMKLRNALQNQH
jgi:hypothetical protein